MLIQQPDRCCNFFLFTENIHSLAAAIRGLPGKIHILTIFELLSLLLIHHSKKYFTDIILLQYVPGLCQAPVDPVPHRHPLCNMNIGDRTDPCLPDKRIDHCMDLSSI